MFVYKFDVLQALKQAGYNTNKLRTEKLLNERAIQDIRDNKIIGIHSLDKLCSLLQLQPSDIIEHIPDDHQGD